MKIRKMKRGLSLLLCAALMMAQLPVVAMAEGAPEDKAIASFAALPDEMARQDVLVGTDLSGLNLPDKLEVTLKTSGEQEVQDSGDLNPESAPTGALSIPIAWESEPEYDPESIGTYLFTADVGGYALSPDAAPPEIIVTVEAPAEKQTPCTKAEGCTLLAGHEGDCVTKIPGRILTHWTFADGELVDGALSLPGVNADHQADFDAVVKLLPTELTGMVEGEAEPATVGVVGWNCDAYIQDGDGNWPLAGEYPFTAELEEGYTADPLPAARVLLPTDGALLGADNVIAPFSLNGILYDDYTYDEHVLTVLDGADMTIRNIHSETPITTDGIVVESGAKNVNLTLDGLNIDLQDTRLGCAFSIEPGAEVYLTLAKGSQNTLKSAAGSAGLQVPAGAKIVIRGGGDLTAVAGQRWYEPAFYGGGAGIGGGSGIGGGDITIESSGAVTATGTVGGAGIGGGDCGSAGTLRIVPERGGTVTAKCNSNGTGTGYGAGIGSGSECESDNSAIVIGGKGTVNADVWYNTTAASIGAGERGDFTGTVTIQDGVTLNARSFSASDGTIGGSVVLDGNAIVFAGKIPDGSLQNGVVFLDKMGTVYGNVTLPRDLTIPADYTLTIPLGSALTVPDDIILNNKGTIINNGTIDNYGTITGNQPSGGTPNGASITAVTVAVWEDGGYGDDTTTAFFGDTLRITATARKESANALKRGAAVNHADFYVGTIAPESKIGTAAVSTDTGTATAALEITLSDEVRKKGFSAGANTIIADFGGADALNLLNSTGTAELTVVEVMLLSDAAAGITAPAAGAVPDAVAAVEGKAGYTAETAVWSGALAADGKFDYSTAYTVEVTLKAKPHYWFADPVVGAINGRTTSVNRISDTEVILSYLFDKTGSKPSGGGSTSGSGSSDPSRSGGPALSVNKDQPSANVNADGGANTDAVAREVSVQLEADKAAGRPLRADVQAKNAKYVAPATLRAMDDAAKEYGGTARLMLDTTKDGRITARIYLEAADAAKLTGNILPGVSADREDTKATRKLFERFFQNDLAVIRMAQQGPIGTPVQVAAKVDIAALDTKNLRFYAFDKKAITYFSIAAPEYRLDSAGYLHFFTDRGGDIVISEGELRKRT